jgi:Holliday junction resolvasome RuvABC endonuclease subunit
MLTINISDFESYINSLRALRKSKDSRSPISIKKNCFSLGSDTSVHSTGICLLETTDTEIKFHILDTIKIKKGISQTDCITTFLGKCALLNASIENILADTNKPATLVIESTFFGGNALVLSSLSRFGGIIIGVNYKLFSLLKLLSPTQSRNLLGIDTKNKLSPKDTAKDIVGRFLTGFNKNITFTQDNDIADAIILATGGLIDD